MISTLGDLTRLRILNQQSDALGQIPQQQLIGQQIQNQTAQIQQQDAMRKAYTGAVVNSLTGIKNPKPDDVYNAITNASRFYPAAAVMGVPNALSDNLTSGGDIAGNVRRAQASILSPEAAATPVTRPLPAPAACLELKRLRKEWRAVLSPLVRLSVRKKGKKQRRRRRQASRAKVRNRRNTTPTLKT